jgi:hypothetical protein
VSDQLGATFLKRSQFTFNDIAWRERPNLIVRFFSNNAKEFIPQIFCLDWARARSSFFPQFNLDCSLVGFDHQSP